MLNIFLFLCLISFSAFVNAQSDLVSNISPGKITMISGKSGSVAFDFKSVDEVENITSLTKNTKSTLANFKSDSGVSSRSVHDAALFKNIAPSVVLVVNKDSIGTGSIINSNGLVLTNWHVVGNYKSVNIILKPASDTQKISLSNSLVASVIKIDQIKDLALLKLNDIPQDRPPIKFGDVSDIGVGLDVHAIGHPNGESWSYTKGVISAYRNGYSWGYGDSKIKHKGDVIQTQTPINPGNSGGPLLSDSGRLIGVNSFVDTSAQGINYAVSIEDVQEFLNSPQSVIVEKKQSTRTKKKCEWKTLYKGKNDAKTADVEIYDTDCNGGADLVLTVPYDKNEAITLEADTNGDGNRDIIWLTKDRNFKWELSLWDDNFDGQWDRAGLHKNGDLTPYRYVPYDVFMAAK